MGREDRAGPHRQDWKTSCGQMHEGKVELIVGEEAPAFTPPPLPVLPHPPPPSLPTHIHFPYILSTAYHVIAETYARKRADMCTGPGSTGRVRDRRCTAKKTINSSPPFLFSLFSLLLSPPLCSAVPFVFDSPRHIPPIYAPSESHLLPNLQISAPFFSKFSFSRCHFLPGLAFPIALFQKRRFESQTTRQKDVFLCLTVGLLIDSCVFAFWLLQEQIPSCPSLFFFFLIFLFFIVTHFSFTFSQLPHFCLSMEFFPPSMTAPPPPLVQSL